MTRDERETQLLIEEINGTLDEILGIHADGIHPDHHQALKRCREILEGILLDYEQDPTNPDTPAA